MDTRLDRLHAWARAQPPLQRLAIIARISLALAFLPTGLVKLLGERFTSMGMDNPVGLFFEALYRSGPYWNFIGASQVLAGALLLVPATSTLGAVVAFPIILNIFVITVSLHFQGTPFVTGAMLLAVLFLLCWDYHRLRAILFVPRDLPPVPSSPVGRLERAGYAIGTVAGLGVFGWTRGFVPRGALLPLLGVGLLAVALVLAAWLRALLRGAPREVALG